MTESAAPGWQGGEVIDDVLFGRHSHLFLAQGAHRSMDLATGTLEIEQSSFEVFEANIRRRAKLAADVGSRYLHVVFPDKQSVLVGEYPITDPVLISGLFKTRCQKIASHVFYASDVLRSEEDVFRRTDTHLTDRATLLVTIELIRRLGIDIAPAIIEEFQTGPFKEKIETGDLGRRLAMPLSSTERFFTRSQRLAAFHNNLKGGNNGIVDIRFSPDAMFSRRLMFFGDSFGRECVRFLSYFFQHTVFLRTPFCHDDLVALYQPDILITENVERYMRRVQSDNARECFLMFPYLSNSEYSPGVDFARAFSAEFSNKLDRYHAYVKRMLVAFDKDPGAKSSSPSPPA